MGPGAYVCQLTITAPVFELRAGGPAAPLAVAATLQRLRQGEAPTPGLLAKSEDWLDDLEQLMGPNANVRTFVVLWIAGGLDGKKLASFIQQADDKKSVFNQLVNADKGIYEQRVIIDDYKNIPGVEKKMYIPNGLTPVVISNSSQ